MSQEKDKELLEEEQKELEKAENAEEAAPQPEEQPDREAELEKQLAESEDKYKRVLAEYQNFRSRTQREREGLYQDSVASTVASFLPVIDTLERAMEQESDENFKKSLELIIKQYTECLDRLGVKPFGERGEPFDPNLHNAVMHVDDEELEAGVIAEVLLKGYIMGERVVRHAMVKAAN